MTDNFSLPIINPEDPSGAKVHAIFPGDLVNRVYKTNPVQYENLRAAKYVLEHPDRIFGGVRMYQEGGWCYVSRPAEWCVASDLITVPFPRDRVFAVYLNPSLFVYEWRAERCDVVDPLSPLGWRERYRRLVWKSTS